MALYLFKEYPKCDNFTLCEKISENDDVYM